MKILYPPAGSQAGDPRAGCLGAAAATSHPASPGLGNLQPPGHLCHQSFSAEKFKTARQNGSAVWSKHRWVLLHISTSTVKSKIIYNVSVGCFQAVEEAKRRTTYQVSRTCAIGAEIMSALTSGFSEWRHLVIQRANLR